MSPTSARCTGDDIESNFGILKTQAITLGRFKFTINFAAIFLAAVG
jgi:hypothetical protein